MNLSLTCRIEWTDPNPTTSPSISGGVDVVWDRGGPGEQTLFGTGGGNGTGPSSSGSLTMSMQRTATTPGNFSFDLSDFTSPHTLSIVSNSMEVGGSDGATEDYQLASGSLSVTYDYVAVPEPAGYAGWAVIGACGLAVARHRGLRRVLLEELSPLGRNGGCESPGGDTPMIKIFPVSTDAGGAGDLSPARPEW